MNDLYFGGVVASKKSTLKQRMEEDWFKQATKRLPPAYRQFGIELRHAHDLTMGDKNFPDVWHHLERAHVLGQSSAWRHLAVHFAMFTYALFRREFLEAVYQIPRMILAVPSSLLKMAPMGNTGRSNVGMFVSLSIPKDLQRYFKPV